ncbi:MAG: tetratricopeptide repeat protein, partial [Clostridia bacterium]|nr:tetratricopeptide repeat protein [Deltaproteobacteria bacterium]
MIGKPKPLASVAPGMPDGVARVVAKCLAPARADRYASMDEVAAALSAVRVERRKVMADAAGAGLASPQKRPTSNTDAVSVKQEAPPGRRSTVVDAVRRKARLNPVLLLAIVASIVAVAAVVALVTRGEKPKVADARVVLVLPFETRGETNEYLGRAFAEALAVNLALTGTIKVLPVPAQTELGTTAMDRASLARDHGAGRLVTGAITRDGEQLEAAVNIIDSGENHIVWGTHDSNSDVSNLAFGVSRDVALQLGASIPKLYDYVANLTGSETMARAADTGVALAAIRGGDISRSLEATAHLEALFPNEMAARALRAQALLLAWDADPSAQKSTAFNEAVVKLESLGPHNPYAEFYRAYLAYGRGDMRTALELFATLLQRDDLAPAARAWVMRYRAMVLGATGDRSGSLSAMEDALSIDPANAWTLGALASILSEVGRYDEALERARQAAVLNPLGWRNHVTLGLALTELKRFDEGASAFAIGCAQSKAQFACALEAVALQHANRPSEASVVADRATRLTDSTWGTYNLACYYAIAGNKRQAVHYLERAVEL